MRIHIYDTTLRDGTQGENITLSVEDKLTIARRLDELGIDYIEGGWPGSNPKDKEFFRRAKELKLEHARIAAFGSTRYPRNKVEADPNVKALLESETPVVTIFGKSWDLHTKRALMVDEATNLAMISETVAISSSTAARSSTTPSISSTATRRTPISRCARSRRRRRPAPTSWCCATPTAARSRRSSARSSPRCASVLTA